MPSAADTVSHDRDELVTRADELVDEGRYLDAVHTYVAANRLRRDPELEVRLIELRRQAFEDQPREPGRTTWPPDAPDPFPGLEDLPEVEPADLTADLVAGAVRHHGVLCVRGLVPRDRAEAVVGTIDHAFAALERWEEALGNTDDPWFVPARDKNTVHDMMRKRNHNAGSMFAAESPPAHYEVLELLQSVGAIDLLGDYLGEPPALSFNKLTLRRVPPTDYSTWHQDGTFMGTDLRSLNVWMTFSACGGDVDDTPALDVVPRRVDLLPPGGEFVEHAVKTTTVHELYGDAIVTPHFEPGDVLLFDDFCLHRTANSDRFTKPRYTVETWFFAPSGFPDYAGLMV